MACSWTCSVIHAALLPHVTSPTNFRAGTACAGASRRPVLHYELRPGHAGTALHRAVRHRGRGQWRRAEEQPQLALRSGIARHVVQLTARDEHRQHYALTSVAPPFTEIALPGVHANIGGGYNQLDEGPKLLSRPRRQLLRRPAVADYQIPPLAMLQATTAYAETQADAERWRQQLGVDEKEIWVDVWHQWAAATRRQPQRAVVTGAVCDRRCGTAPAHRLALPADRTAGDAAAGHRCRRAMDCNAAEVPGWELPSALRPIARRLVAGQPLTATQEALLRRRYLMQSAHWNFDALGDTALTYAADAGVSELPYRPGPGLFYINRPTVDGKRVVLPNA